MRFITGFFLILLLSFIFYYFTPAWWWAPVVIGALVGFSLQLHSVLSFLYGFLSIGLFWAAMIYWQDSLNTVELSSKMAKIIGVGSPFYLLIIAAVLGGLITGLATLSGKLLRDIVSDPIKPKKQKRGKQRRKYK